MDKRKETPVMTPNPKAGSSINDLLFLARAYEENGEYDIAKPLYERASSSFDGMLNYAHFLLSTPPCGDMSKQDQLKKAERMLIYVEENSNNENQIGRACEMLADLYRHTNAIRSLGYYMRANRCGKSVDPNLQTQLLKRVAKMEIAEVERDVPACYIVGTEFYELGHDFATMKWAMYFLEMVVQSNHKQLVGLAAMLMADIYEKEYHDKTQSAYYKGIAAKNGNPEVLTKHLTPPAL